MTAEELSFRRESIEQLLRNLGNPNLCFINESEEMKDRFAQKVEAIYADGYRLPYSDIQSMIVNICNEEYYGELCIDDNKSTDEQHGDSDIVGFNLDYLVEFIKHSDKYDDQVFMGAFKLKDHALIEIWRYRDNADIVRSIDFAEYRLKKAENTALTLEGRCGELEYSLEVAESNAQSLQMHMVGILGVFAAIAMVFSGGLDLISGAMAASKDVPIFQTAFIVLLCGTVMFNIIVFLMISIERIMTLKDRNRHNKTEGIMARFLVCLSDNHAAIVVNIILIACMLIDCCLWTTI